MKGAFNQTVTTAVTALAEAQAKTEAKVDRLVDPTTPDSLAIDALIQTVAALEKIGRARS